MTRLHDRLIFYYDIYIAPPTEKYSDLPLLDHRIAKEDIELFLAPYNYRNSSLIFCLFYISIILLFILFNLFHSVDSFRL